MYKKQYQDHSLFICNNATKSNYDKHHIHSKTINYGH